MIASQKYQNSPKKNLKAFLEKARHTSAFMRILMHSKETKKLLKLMPASSLEGIDILKGCENERGGCSLFLLHFPSILLLGRVVVGLKEIGAPLPLMNNVEMFVRCKNVPMIELFLQNGIDIDSEAKGHNVLSYNMTIDNGVVVDFLLGMYVRKGCFSYIFLEKGASMEKAITMPMFVSHSEKVGAKSLRAVIKQKGKEFLNRIPLNQILNQIGFVKNFETIQVLRYDTITCILLIFLSSINNQSFI